jgi:outer membrane biosynthesis protein TonB
MRVAVALLLFAAIATPARAGVDDEERARGHYEIGVGLYRLGDYRGALKEFGAGYELARKPGFLINLGQTYRKLDELREARDMYRQFLRESHADDPARPEARKVLEEIEAAIRTQPAAPAPPPPPPPRVEAPSPAAPSPNAPSPTAQPTVAPPVEPAPPTVITRAPHRPRRGLRIAGIVVGVVGIGLLGGGIGAAVAADDDARELNALDRAGGAFDPSKDRAYTVDRALSAGLFAGGALLAAGGAVLLIVSAR